jgi:hypothetical protein
MRKTNSANAAKIAKRSQTCLSLAAIVKRP